MIYTAALQKIFRCLYGEPSEVPETESTGLVLVADGVGGFALCGTALRYLLGAKSPKGPSLLTVRVMDWGHGLWRWHADLTSVHRHTEQAKRLAEWVTSWKAQHPTRPVYLVGKSGGTGIVVRALEQLPADAVEEVVLLAPALSPHYNLEKSLRAVRHEMVVFWSPLDLVVLGAGTWLFGTIDRKRSPSAGLVGFRPPRAAANPLYRKLRQVRWRPGMIPTGYLGGHIGPDMPAFLRAHVVPLFRPPIQQAPEPVPAKLGS